MHVYNKAAIFRKLELLLQPVEKINDIFHVSEDESLIVKAHGDRVDIPIFRRCIVFDIKCSCNIDLLCDMFFYSLFGDMKGTRTQGFYKLRHTRTYP